MVYLSYQKNLPLNLTGMSVYGVFIERTPDYSIHVRDGGSTQMYDFSANTQAGRDRLFALGLLTTRPATGINRQLMTYERPGVIRNPFMQYPAWSPRTQSLLKQ